LSPDFNPSEFAGLAESLHSAMTPVETAEEVVDFAVSELDADSGGITVVLGGGVESLAASDAQAEKMAALQVDPNEGPWRDSARHEHTLECPNLTEESRWPRWAAQALTLGVRSMLTTDMTDMEGRRIGSLSLYWRRPRNFTASEVAFVEIARRHAAVALANSLNVTQLNVALDTRKRIGQAQGILMERYGLDEARAFEVLRRYSMDHNIKLRQVAEDLVSSRQLPDAGFPEAPDRGAST
jgi:GAF domain-containing protein